MPLNLNQKNLLSSRGSFDVYRKATDTPPNVDVLILPKPKQEQTVKKRTPPPQLKGKMIFDDDVWDTSEMFEDWEHFKE